MRVEGEADELYEVLFPNGLVPQILRLLVDTWRSFERPTQDEDEPKITNRFVNALQKEGRRRRAQFRIMSHVKDLETLDPKSGRGFVEIDIYVPYGFEPRCYFGIEAKKLHTANAGGKWESQAGDYTGKEGMGCFIDGRYASLQCEAAMIGYVMDGDCEGAKTNVKLAIEKRSVALRVSLPCELHPATGLPDYSHAFETRHERERGEFTIHHVLLDV